MQKFKLGQVVATHGVSLKVEEDNSYNAFIQESLSRHLAGDWGIICDEDKKLNDESLKTNDRLVSKYSYAGTEIYIITEWDRSVTTVLFPSEY